MNKEISNKWKASITATEPVFGIKHTWKCKTLEKAKQVEVQLALTGWRKIKITGA